MTVPSDSEVNATTGKRTPIFNEVNNTRVRDFHQLSLSFNKDRKTSNGNTASWRYGFQNIYLRNNEDQPEIIYNSLRDQYEFKLSDLPGIPIPFIAFSYTF